MAVLALVAVWSTVGLTGCGWWQADDDEVTALDIVRSPEFVNRMIPGERPLALVEVTGDAQSGPIELSAVSSLESMSVRFEPATVEVGDVAEMWVQVPEVGEDTPFSVTITASRDDEEATRVVAGTAVPGTDDLGETAAQIAQVFLDDVARGVNGLPTTAAELTGGTPVAGLLVVSHYAWFTQEYEVGLAWHIMVAPDDFAELYVRPRGALAPTRAYRISSWSSALAGEPVAVVEIDPPAEVTR